LLYILIVLPENLVLQCILIRIKFVPNFLHFLSVYAVALEETSQSTTEFTSSLNCSGFIDRRAVPKTAALCCSALCSGDLCSAALCSLLVYDYALEDDDPLL
jgi:hypothetical protein